MRDASGAEKMLTRDKSEPDLMKRKCAIDMILKIQTELFW